MKGKILILTSIPLLSGCLTSALLLSYGYSSEVPRDFLKDDKEDFIDLKKRGNRGKSSRKSIFT
ncbi:hypothetical protein BKK52_11155 [Rodentibacter trehalosifermentans]|uniref:Lipoprotein n=1 Tax=Rodentibacter trehalosifermentans TaxID=1908263 RepID=A0A1V3IXD0_9PAST|nr:hypothetical protein [Rodentibacter trehalosifermentans]OOF46632.1 hypothetical protein BKK52_11155 [Rodentibacter trehalosifermentans]